MPPDDIQVELFAIASGQQPEGRAHRRVAEVSQFARRAVVRHLRPTGSGSCTSVRPRISRSATDSVTRS